jgi:TPR repeat protein
MSLQFTATLNELELDDTVVSWKEVFTKIKYLGNLSKAARIVDPLLMLKLESAIETVLETLPTNVQERLKIVTLQLEKLCPEPSEAQFRRIQADLQELETFQSKSIQDKFLYAYSFDEKDPERFFKFMLLVASAAPVGSLEYNASNVNVAYCYMNGYGTTRNPQLGFEITLEIAKAGDIYAIKNLGLYYANGRGTDQDPEKAYETFLVGAKQGCNVCQYEVAYCYQRGRGTARNKNLAKEWFVCAAQNGNVGAANFLKSFD